MSHLRIGEFWEGTNWKLKQRHEGKMDVELFHRPGSQSYSIWIFEHPGVKEESLAHKTRRSLEKALESFEKLSDMNEALSK